MRRIALFSDVHGNLLALDAVLASIEECAIEDIYCLGDLVGYGPDPSGVIARIRERGIPTIQGNYDDGIGNRRGECGCYYATEQARIDGAASYDFTDAAVTDDDREWLASLRHEIRLEVAGARMLLAHGSPRKINEYLLPDRSDTQLARLAEQADADIVCVGHVHIPYHRVVLGARQQPIHYVSSGSAGKPKDGDWRACWVELLIGAEAELCIPAAQDPACGPVGTSGAALDTRIHRVEYDVAAVVDRMATVGLPTTLAEALRRG